MEILIHRNELLNVLSLISGAVEKRQTLPILSHLLLTIEDNKLHCVATDLELQLSASCDVISVKNPVEITAPAKKLMDICRALPDGSEIKLCVNEHRLSITSGKSRFQLALLPAHEFPAVSLDKAQASFLIPQKQIKGLIDKTAFAMAQQDVRYYLNGMLFEMSSKGVHVVATDGHRLALSEFCQAIPSVKQSQAVIVPRKAVLELSRLLDNSDDEVTLSFSNNHIHISHDRFQFTSKLIDGKFPDYKRVMPKGIDKYVYHDRAEFKQALVRASILCNEKFHGVRLTFSASSTKIEANNPEQEQAQDEVVGRYEGEDIQLGFNVNYILDVLNVLPDGDIKISLANPNSSVLFESCDDSDNSVYIIMPMRL